MTSRSLPVHVASQVSEFIRLQSPDRRRRLRLAVRALGSERGDIKALEGDLAGYHRLLLGSFRVILAYASSKRGPVIECFFIERRDVVYLMLHALMKAGLLNSKKDSVLD
jgi:mRNA interferase RelE/StbE